MIPLQHGVDKVAHGPGRHILFTNTKISQSDAYLSFLFCKRFVLLSCAQPLGPVASELGAPCMLLLFAGRCISAPYLVL
jgi:hypothetical protein